MREVDDELVARARIYVDNREAVLAEAGDLLSPLARGIITADAIVGDLPSIAPCTVRAQAGGISLFKSVGIANPDLAAGELLWQRGHAQLRTYRAPTLRARPGRPPPRAR